MKKIISLTLTAIILLSCTVLPAFAAADGLSREDAVKLFELSFYRFMLLRYGDPSLNGDNYNSYEMKKFVGYTVMYVDPADTAPDNIPDGYGLASFLEPAQNYAESTTIHLTIHEVNTFIKEAFTDEMIPRIMKRSFDEDDNKVDLFYSDPVTGKLYANENIPRQWTMYHITSTLVHPDVEVIDFNSNIDSAEMKVIMYHGRAGLDYTPTTETVEFKKTDKGWRVSGGSAYEWLLENTAPTHIYERTEFEKLAKWSFDRFMMLQYGEAYGYEYKSEDGNYVRYYENYLYNYNYQSEITLFSGIPYQPMTHADDEFTTVAQFKAYGNEVMTTGLTDRALIFGDNIDNIKEENGKLYIYKNLHYNRPYAVFTNYGELTMHSDTQASMNVVIKISPDGSSRLFKYSTETVEFAKTSDGWRVSGGTMFDALEGKALSSPDTGDESTETVIVICLIALVAIAVPFTYRSKKRTIK